MVGLLTPFKRSQRNGADDDPVDLPDDEVDGPYETRPTRPMAQLAVRIGLWAAVVFGCVGGVLALLGLTTREGDTVYVEQTADVSGQLPAPVANVAEDAVEAWLTARPGDEPELARLYVEPPSVTEQVVRAHGPATAVAGGRWEDGYWLVTVAVDTFECVPGAADSDAADSGAAELDGGETAAPIDCRQRRADQVRVPTATTWFVEVGVVGNVDGRLAALATPSVVDAPPEISPDWASTGRNVAQPEEDEPVAATVEAFLQAWLTGDGDVDRLTAPGLEVEPLDPRPFIELELVEIAYQEEAEGRGSVRAHILATTPGGAEIVAGYELGVEFRADRWEIVEHWGAPPLAARPDDDDEED